MPNTTSIQISSDIGVALKYKCLYNVLPIEVNSGSMVVSQQEHVQLSRSTIADLFGHKKEWIIICTIGNRTGNIPAIMEIPMRFNMITISVRSNRIQVDVFEVCFSNRFTKLTNLKKRVD